MVCGTHHLRLKILGSCAQRTPRSSDRFHIRYVSSSKLRPRTSFPSGSLHFSFFNAIHLRGQLSICFLSTTRLRGYTHLASEPGSSSAEMTLGVSMFAACLTCPGTVDELKMAGLVRMKGIPRQRSMTQMLAKVTRTAFLATWW